MAWRQALTFLLSPSLFCISKLLVCFPSCKLPLREDFTPAERATISRRPLLFLLYLPPRLSRPSTPPPSLAEWQYHLPPNRKRWTVNLGQSAVKNMTHSSTMKTWQTQTHTHTLACTHIHTQKESHATVGQSNQKHTVRLFTNAIYSIIKYLIKFLPLNRQAETHSHLPLLYLFYMPAGCDSTCLFQLLSISNCPLSLSCAALPYCSVSFIFPTSLVESASFFLLPLSFFPSPTTLYHFSLDSLSLSYGIASNCASPMSDNMWWTSSDSPDGAFVLKATAKEQQHYSAMNQGIVQEEILVY